MRYNFDTHKLLRRIETINSQIFSHLKYKIMT